MFECVCEEWLGRQGISGESERGTAAQSRVRRMVGPEGARPGRGAQDEAGKAR